MKSLLKHLGEINVPLETKLLVYQTYFKSSEEMKFNSKEVRKEYLFKMTESYLEKYTGVNQ